jgi:hypothetical protein
MSALSHRCCERVTQSLAERLDGWVGGSDAPVFSSTQPMQALAIGWSPVGAKEKPQKTLLGQGPWRWAITQSE